MQVYFPFQGGLQLHDPFHQLCVFRLADDEQVHIASRIFLPTCEGTEDERQLDTSTQGFKGLMDHLDYAAGFYDQGVELLINGTGGIGTVEDLSTSASPR
ncbi:MAG: hypothetical protein A2Y64_02195 [Candidatus Coatesbacteria bacterium RBG_13_66_14]|uniref:Uncharacterized protein n=1 Tax=Candidatus Coatesbacteria bacterium RBG_13_66_14 TaxID=1817816 RepID=A0A1F5FGS1_9BACT|nr:MAG: hypothetical protein A2Y64_02195 [Candidatus Coatesbacteria bacterium RBG_13_66_14]